MSETDGSRSSASSGPEAEQLVDHVRDQRLALEQAERHARAFALHHPDDQVPDLRLRLVLAHAGEPIEVQTIQQLLVDAAFQLLVV